SLSSNNVNVTNISTSAITYAWDFGNGITSMLTSPAQVTYTANGTYTITLIASNACNTDTTRSIITILSAGLKNNSLDNSILVWPNPSFGKITVDNTSNALMDVAIYSLEGRLVYSKNNVAKKEELNISKLVKGLYEIKIKTGEKTVNKKLVIE
ncbi:MAG: T9SS type A sorting domain-containing protein, partial [Bacteroidota bacterium]